MRIAGSSCCVAIVKSEYTDSEYQVCIAWPENQARSDWRDVASREHWWTCMCPAWKFHVPPRKDCKHITQTKNEMFGSPYVQSLKIVITPDGRDLIKELLVRSPPGTFNLRPVAPSPGIVKLPLKRRTPHRFGNDK